MAGPSWASAAPAALYLPSRAERELIARMLDYLQHGGYETAALPPIVLSDEPPPLFIRYPELEDDEPQPRGDDQPHLASLDIPRNRERGRPEKYPIEQLLGCYRPGDQTIVLYARGIGWYGRRVGADAQALQAVVLVHEIAHWAAHVLPHPEVPLWPLNTYVATSTAVHEGWAQLIT